MEQKNGNFMEEENLAMRVSLISIVINTILSALKLAAGVIARSGAMVSDAVHSLSDVLSTFVVMAGVKLSKKESDKEHPYGHERLECVAAIILATMLLLTGLGIGANGINSIKSGNNLQAPGLLALVAAVASIAIKEWMFWFTRSAAKKINSGALMADAWHHRSDALSSVGSFIGILGARIGFPVLDPVASIVICIFIVKAAYDIFKDAIDKMVDKACDEETQTNLHTLIMQQEGVLGIDLLHSRLFGNKIYVDVEILVDGHTLLQDSHQIAENVHDTIELNFTNVKHCMVHVNPASSSETQNTANL
ncbi:MAG: cation diffusion facilitator family transporter [Oscillospiraceae bacterium]|nr:cation diffusion facilitator family transporter [Oscillospiraceae bacterium]